MEKRVKLTPKKLEAIQSIQGEKAKLNQAFQILNEKEGLIINLVMEDAGIAKAKSVKIDGEFLVFEIEEPKTTPKKKVKKEEPALAVVK